MITENLSFEIFCNTGEVVNWTISSNDPCASFSPSSGTVSGQSTNVSVVVTFADEDCFNNAVITISTTDEGGITTTTTLNIQNPCGTLNAVIGHQPTAGHPHTLIAYVSGGNPSYSYQWSFDQNVFDVGGATTSSVLLLKAKSGATLPDFSDVNLIVSDAKGCSTQKQFTVNLQPPSAQFVKVRSLSCIDPITTPLCGEVNQVSSVINLQAFPAAGKTIDWGTLVISLPPGFCIGNQQLPSQGADNINITIYANNMPNAEYIGTWSVADNEGIRSNVVNINIGVPECALSSLVYVEPTYYEVSLGELTPGTEIEIPIDEKVHPRECCESASDSDFYPDWDTFTFVAASGQVLVSATELTSTNGSAELTKERNIKYTVGAMPSCNTDLIQFKIENKAGGKSNMGKVVFDYIRRAAPVAVDDADCVICGEFVTVDVLANDTGDINPATVNIISEPSKGTWTVGSDGMISFSPFFTSQGLDYIEYKVSNPDGEESNTAMLTLTIVCAGRSPINAGNKCKVIVNLESMLASYATTGGTWSASLANPSVVSLVAPNAVDFAAAAAGDYLFSYSVTSGLCTTRVDVNLTIINAPANNACAGAIAVSYPALAGLQHTLFNQAITECTTDSGVALPAGWYGTGQGDIWFTFTTNAVVDAKIIVNGQPFLNRLINPQVAVYSGNCGALVLTGSNSLNNNASYLELSLPTLTALTQYWIRVSGQEAGEFNLTIETQ
jgi:hypothetical protein